MTERYEIVAAVVDKQYFKTIVGRKPKNEDEINNYRLFPNIFVHVNCVTTKKECIIKLAKSYKAYEDFKRKHIFWERKDGYD